MNHLRAQALYAANYDPNDPEDIAPQVVDAILDAVLESLPEKRPEHLDEMYNGGATSQEYRDWGYNRALTEARDILLAAKEEGK